MPKFCDSVGVYFLIDRKKIVYIGATTRWPGRLAGHIHKNFNKTRFIPCRKRDLQWYEMRWIRKFQPELNRRFSAAHHCWSVSEFV